MEPDTDEALQCAPDLTSLQALPPAQVDLTRLPPFSLTQFMGSRGAGKRWRDGRRNEDAERWTTPGLIPLAEPPDLDWHKIAEEKIASDLRHRRLFPNDPEKRAASKDLEGEKVALGEYYHWIAQQRRSANLGDGRARFYAGLTKEVEWDMGSVAQDRAGLEEETTYLQRFEFEFRPNNGELEGMERNLENVSYQRPWVEETVRGKYGDMLVRVNKRRRERGLKAIMNVDEW